MKRQQQTTGLLMSIQLTPEDAAQVKAILLTHAEMQDQSMIQGEATLGRLRADEPGEVDMIADLEETLSDISEDSENLKRLASLFN